MTSPFEALGAIAIQEAEVTPGYHHVELYTRGGLLTLLWHGDRTEDAYVVMCGGAMGGLLGPADGAYHDIGTALADRGIGAIRVGYRRPNSTPDCVHDMAAAIELAARAGADRFITVGHSFGGAVAVNTAIALPDEVAGIITLATQSGDCQEAGHLRGKPMLLIHGDRDEILPMHCSQVVNQLAGGTGEVMILPGAGHLLNQNGAGQVLREKILEWAPAVLAAATRPS